VQAKGGKRGPWGPNAKQWGFSALVRWAWFGDGGKIIEHLLIRLRGKNLRKSNYAAIGEIFGERELEGLKEKEEKNDLLRGQKEGNEKGPDLVEGKVGREASNNRGKCSVGREKTIF